MTHTYNLIEAKISMKARKIKQKRERRNYNIVGSGQLLSCFFFFAFQVAKLFYNVCFHLISKWIIKNILSFPLTPRAAAYNNNNVTLAILKYKSLF